ncbi:MAG: hypothetical protein HC828_07840 [Blastochloris sp.]|nr:hypothetical protein [Blastochloris sp.]
MKPKSQNEYPTPEDGIDLVATSGIILRVIAHFNETLYTEGSSTENERQAAVVAHNDLSNPASEKDTSQG